MNNSQTRTIRVSGEKNKVIKNKPRVKRKVKEVDKDILTNRGFVDEYEAIEKKAEEISERNEKVKELISEIKASILMKSKELEEITSKETKYIAKHQKLSVLHEDCDK